MKKWITHRLPTEADIDSENEVLVPWKHGCTPDSCYQRFQDYRWVVPGQPWWPGNAKARKDAAAEQEAAAAAHPAPAAEPTPAPAPESTDPMEQALQECYRAEAALIKARNKLVLAQAKAIAVPPYPPQSGAIQPPMFPGQPVPEGLFSH
jgi:hypothetical protein